MQTLIEAGDAGYLRGDYEGGRQAFEPVYQELRATIEGILKLLEAPPPKTPPRKAAPPRRAE